MTWPAQRFEVAVVVSAAVSFRNDVVDRLSRTRPAAAKARLTDVPITFKDAGADDFPLAAVAALVATQPSLMLMPAFAAVSIAVTRTISGCLRATAFTTCTRDSDRHSGVSFILV
ncbi:hypothetical protein ES15_1271 [Cronobacter sakazakii ES15]|nr:hypothetical protein ES15_1271 [Cronobacter sakazakii ES15]